MKNAIKRQYSLFKSLYTYKTFLILMLMICIYALVFQEYRINPGIWTLIFFTQKNWKSYVSLRYQSKKTFFVDMLGVSLITFIFNAMIIAFFYFGVRSIFGPEILMSGEEMVHYQQAGLNIKQISDDLFWKEIYKSMAILYIVGIIQVFSLTRIYRIHSDRPKEMGTVAVKIIIVITLISCTVSLPLPLLYKVIVGSLASLILIYQNYKYAVSHFDLI
ncbi:hypothetical protein PT105_04865 [Erysipelothrix rhusiopathiae]|uniref:hypothetical protein n=1 Tax=Erysipelothrix rhusiopathiae TaxID=1648 RepID=UPI000F4378FB|nr:hypothetical protein [Erysipelothrix rhusiopathiae]AYV35088.1 hypothetical protein EEY85_07180 [Erysipelothrix rhusiopathiae]MDE8081964.1 hypothetical protein [Erysipelothrix rhusiopathiae]MDE8314709.1 hypothetical protein [Erysipelothrix rhusiopathiae]